MVTKRVAVAAENTVSLFSMGVTAAYGGAGDLFNNSTVSLSVLLRNAGDWPFEYKVGAGDWQRLPLRGTTNLDIDLSSTTVRVRMAQFALQSQMEVEIETGPDVYLAGEEQVDLGEGGGGGTFATQEEAEAGTSNTVYMNPLRTAEAIAALGEAGATELDDLSDVVVSSAAVGDYLRHDGSTFVNVKGVDLVRTVSGTADTPTTADEGRVIRFTSSSAITVTIPTALNGTAFTIEWLAGAGTITLDASAGVNLNGLGDGVNIVLSAASGSVTFIPSGANTWDVIGSIGDLVAADITDSTSIGRSVVTAASEADARAAIDAAGYSQTFGYNATFPTGADDTFPLDLDATFAYTINNTVTDCVSGTATYRLQINGTNVGTTANSVSSTETTQTHSADNAVAAGDRVDLVRSADSSCVMGSIKVNCTRTLA